jgi:hypothetical protein
MSPRTKRWLIDVSLVTAAACLFLPTYIRDRQYGGRHAEAGKVLDEAHTSAGTNYDRYNEIVADYRRDHGSPEFYYQKREVWGRAAVGIFVIPVIVGLACRRWVACVVVLTLWIWSWTLIGLRY